MPTSDCSPEEIKGLLHGLELQRTELEAQNRRLQQYRDRYVDLYDSAPVGYATLDEDGYVQEINLTGARLLGAERDSLTGYPLAEFVAKEDQKAFLDHARRCLHGQCEVTSELTLVARGGRSFTAQLRSVPAKSAEGDTHCRTAIIDITERKQMEETIRQSQAFLQTVIDSIPDPMLVIDRDHRTVLANRAAREMAGEIDPVSRCLTCYWLAHQRDLPCAGQNECPLQRVVEERAPTTVIHTRQGTGGAESFIEVLAAPILNEAGEVAHIIETRRDITRRQREVEALRQSEERLRLVLQAASTGWWEWDLTNDILLADERCKALFGLPPAAESSREVLFQHVHPDDHLLVQKGLEDALAKPGDYRSEFRVIWPDGSVHWLLGKGRSIHESSPQRVRLMGVATDITERKHAEEQVGLLSRFPEENPHPVLRILRDGTLAYANRASTLLLKTWGCQPGQSVPKDWRARVAASFDSGTVGQVEATCDGRTLLCVLAPVIGAGYVNVYGNDITERKQAEAALCESEARFRTMADATPIMVWQSGADKRCDYFNKGWLEFTGRTMEQELGNGWATGVHPDDLQSCLDTYNCAFDRREPFTMEYRLRHHSGEHRWILDRGVPRFSPDEAFLGYIGGCIDIEDRKCAEEELKAARESAECAKGAAEHANRAKDHFLAVLSHELRTPLTPVLMGVSMLQDRPDIDPGIHETLEMVRRNVEMEAQLIDDLLDVTRIARGKVELSRSTVELCTVINRAVEVCKPDIDARGLRFSVDLGPAAPYWVEADISRLQQVFWNLLNNAIKFTPHGGRLEVRFQPDAGSVVVEVKDNGIGIEAEALPRIFDAFEQAERSITRRFGGLGLGLAISKALVEMHGGTISVHSEGHDKGATFRIRLPLTAPAGQPEMPAPLMPPMRAVRSLHILLVEDHGVTTKMMRMILTAEGHTVETAGDVATALELAGQQAFDLLVSDLGLPDGSGHDLMRRLRERGYRLSGIALTGYGQEEDIRRSREAGFAVHLTKPASRERLVEAIASVTAGSR